MVDPVDLLWKPLFEASAQIIVGAIGSYGISKALRRFTSRNTFDGPMDLWKRGILMNNVGDNDQVYIDGTLSSFTQLFPGNPMKNGSKWNTLYEFEGKIGSSEYQTMDFYAGGDAALRVGAFNGETIVGIFARYGYVGDGLIGVIDTHTLKKLLPSFFEKHFVGTRVLVGGRLVKNPSQHSSIFQQIANKANIKMDISQYDDIYYLKINSLQVYTKDHERTFTLIGSPWAATNDQDEQYLVQYGYLENPDEVERCLSKMKSSKNWDKACVYFDHLTTPSEEMSFRKKFIG